MDAAKALRTVPGTGTPQGTRLPCPEAAHYLAQELRPKTQEPKETGGRTTDSCPPKAALFTVSVISKSVKRSNGLVSYCCSKKLPT